MQRGWADWPFAVVAVRCADAMRCVRSGALRSNRQRREKMLSAAGCFSHLMSEQFVLLLVLGQ